MPSMPKASIRAKGIGLLGVPLYLIIHNMLGRAKFAAIAQRGLFL